MKTDTETENTPSLRDVINASYKELDTASEDAETQTSGEEVVVQEEIEAQTDETTELESSESESDETTEAVETILAPENWSDEWRQKFDGLPDEGKTLALDQWTNMQSDYTKKSEEIADITKAVEPFKEQIALRGASPGQVIQQLLYANASLQRDPVGTLVQIANSMRVDPKALGEKLGLVQADTSETEEYTDPEVLKLRKDMAELKQGLQQTQTTAQQATIDKGNQILNEFKSAKNEDGTLKHPHFDKVTPVMTALLQASHQTTLDQA